MRKDGETINYSPQILFSKEGWKGREHLSSFSQTLSTLCTWLSLVTGFVSPGWANYRYPDTQLLTSGFHLATNKGLKQDAWPTPNQQTEDI